ncbi:MAG: diiron oxygenase [Deltaproteobacteria bacterium]|nr:diiron oxygenase [Deltaproteobacteria bacterium]
MDLQRMLRMCRENQWSVRDLDWSQKPRPMSLEDEAAVVQYFTDMSQIERLAGALFVEQERRVEDPTLKQIFATFVTDEMRHSHVAQMLADHYDVHRLRTYRPSKSLLRFFPHFIEAVRHLADDVANAYITSGELILDIALLRSIDDFVADPLSAQAMELINRDESRHIAIDYHMVGFYASEEYRTRQRTKKAKKSMREHAHAARVFSAMTLWGRPFFQDVFFAPMDKVDPTGRRLKEAFKRMQILGARPGIEHLPLVKFWSSMLELYQKPWMGKRGKAVVARLVGADARFMEYLATEEELARSKQMSLEELAREALAVKNAS